MKNKKLKEIELRNWLESYYFGYGDKVLENKAFKKLWDEFDRIDKLNEI